MYTNGDYWIFYVVIFKEKNIGKFRTAGYFLELARIIEKRKLLES